MSRLILNQIFKPTVSKYFLRHKNVRLFSSTTTTHTKISSDGEIIDLATKLQTPINCSFSSTPTFPFLLIDYILNTPDSPDARVIRTYKSDILEEILIRDKKLVEEVRQAMTIGFSSHGNGFEFKISDTNPQEILIDYKPSNNAESTPKNVRLPPLPADFRIQSIAMANDRNSEDSLVVGVKSWGSKLSIYRAGNGKWIKISPEFVHPFSSLMYSKKDERFYIPSPAGNYLCFLDLYFKEGEHPEFIELYLDDDHLPKSVRSELFKLNPCSRTDHLVESPSGEQFLIHWYSDDTRYTHNKVETLSHTTLHFTVFTVEEELDDDKVMVYTEDIGDLCIFLGHSQAFCIQASSCPGLKPNCIYFVGYNFGVYDLTTKIVTRFYAEEGVPLRNLEFPYWPPPVPLYS